MYNYTYKQIFCKVVREYCLLAQTKHFNLKVNKMEIVIVSTFNRKKNTKKTCIALYLFAFVYLCCYIQ